MKLYFGDFQVSNGDLLDFHSVQKRIRVEWNPVDDLEYTFLFCDLDNPDGVYTHWLRIHNSSFHGGEDVLPYIPPDPFTLTNRYVFLILKENRGFKRFPSISRLDAYDYVMKLSPRPFDSLDFMVTGEVERFQPRSPMSVTSGPIRSPMSVTSGPIRSPMSVTSGPIRSLMEATSSPIRSPRPFYPNLSPKYNVPVERHPRSR